jgi:hypothetical protein
MLDLAALRTEFRREGACYLRGLVPAHDCGEALAAAEEIFYGGPYAAWLRAFDEGRATVPADGIGGTAGGRRTAFPVGVNALDRLAAAPGLLDAAAALLDDAPFFCEGRLFARTGPVDARFSPAPDGGWHFDHYHHGLLPPSGAPERCEYLNLAIALDDVGPDDAPTEYFAGSRDVAARAEEEELAAGASPADGSFREAPRLCRGLPLRSALLAAGDAVIYSSLLIHRARPFVDRRRRRLLWTVSAGARTRAAYCRSDHPFSLEARDAIRPLLVGAPPQLRTFLGWPPPGDPYYTPETLRLLARRHPGIDLSPYARPEAP